MQKNLKIATRISITVFVLILALCFSQTAFAASNVVAASSTTQLQADLDTIMHNRLTNYTIVYTGNLLTLKSDISTAINNIYKADNYLEYSTNSVTHSYTVRGNTATISFRFNYLETKAQSDFVTQKCTQILGQIITSDMIDYQKEKAIHDWIEANVSYDTTMVQHSAYAALVAPYETVCQGYALLTYRMFSLANIPVKIIVGTVNENGQVGGHAWNLVQIGGNWYQLDTTWDDPIPDVPGRITYTFYNLTDTQMAQVHSWTKGSYPVANTSFENVVNAKLNDSSISPSLKTFFQDLYYKIGLQYFLPQNIANTSADIQVAIQNAINNNQTELKIRYMSESTAANDLTNIFKGFGNVSSYTYTASDFVRSTDTTNDAILDITWVMKSN